MSTLNVKIENREGHYIITSEDMKELLLAGTDLTALLADMPAVIDKSNELNGTDWLMADHGYAP